MHAPSMQMVAPRSSNEKSGRVNYTESWSDTIWQQCSKHCKDNTMAFWNILESLTKDQPDERLPLVTDHPDDRPIWWETTLMKDHPDEPSIMRNQPDNRQPWWETSMVKDHPDDRPPCWETNMAKDHPDDRPPWWETTLMTNQYDERPPWWQTTLMRDHPCFKTTFFESFPSYFHVLEPFTKGCPSFEMAALLGSYTGFKSREREWKRVNSIL